MGLRPGAGFRADQCRRVGQHHATGRVRPYPQPRLIYAQPVVIVPSPVAVYQQPIYLYVPPKHQKNWKHDCRRYNACGQPVYFVRDDWVRERYDEHRGRGPGNGNAYGHDKGKKWNNGNKGNKGNKGNNGKGGHNG